MTSGTPALFLDRDGTLIADVPYLADASLVRLLPGAGALVREANALGWPVVIVTNQSGIARQLITAAQYQEVAARVEALLAVEGGTVAATYHCPHEPSITGPCDCRKPATGMYRQAARELTLALGSSVYIGDRWRDVAAAVETGGFGLMIPGVQTNAEDLEQFAEAAARGARLHRIGSLREALAFLRTMPERAA
jgi:histidinol-phosphate phosphatase family protein